jgi:hypothetical protein
VTGTSQPRGGGCESKGLAAEVVSGDEGDLH